MDGRRNKVLDKVDPLSCRFDKDLCPASDPAITYVRKNSRIFYFWQWNWDTISRASIKYIVYSRKIFQNYPKNGTHCCLQTNCREQNKQWCDAPSGARKETGFMRDGRARYPLWIFEFLLQRLSKHAQMHYYKLCPSRLKEA